MILTALKRIGRAVYDWFDPVCQDPEEILYGRYDGAVVRLRPVVENGRVTEWVPDLDEVAALRRTPAQPAAAPPPLPPTFNPAGVAGL